MRTVCLGKDNPVLDKEHPPGVAGFSCVSGDVGIFGLVYYAEGLCNPTVVLCHGFPGMEKNGDIAQNLRRAGFNVVIFSYRGAWGSQGAFSFFGTVEDTQSVVRHVARKKLPEPDRFDSGRIVLVGHSMGAFAAFKAAAALPAIRDIALLTVWNIGLDAGRMGRDEETKKRVDYILDGVGCLAGATRAALLNEILQNEDVFDLQNDATAFRGRRVLLLGAKEDLFTPGGLHQALLAKALRREASFVSEKSLACDHVFSAKRNAVSRVLLKWLAEGGY
ncbi:MAG: alpha/beta hydrolase [Synergistaceae bacterium]|jgi:pimeloyl-ACP methyl ester carboxylesterase|nr:alpha/beta hydrolase [Synergistaceae bacterium]